MPFVGAQTTPFVTQIRGVRHGAYPKLQLAEVLSGVPQALVPETVTVFVNLVSQLVAENRMFVTNDPPTWSVPMLFVTLSRMSA